MNKRADLRGVYAPLTTPFHPSGELNIAALEANMSFYAQSPLHGYLALGSNGENRSLQPEEQEAVLSIILKRRGAAQKVMVGCTAESTREAVSFAKKAADLGCDYITLLAPHYFKKQMTDEILERFFVVVADQSPIPCLLYNAPGFAGGLSLSSSLVGQLSKHPNICGIKDSSIGNFDHYLMAVPDDFSVMAGTISIFLASLCSGSVGGVLSLANIFPEVIVELFDLFEEGHYDSCFELNNRLLRGNKSISGSGGVASVKAAMDLRGLFGGAPREPLLPQSERQKHAMRDILIKEGLLHS